MIYLLNIANSIYLKYDFIKFYFEKYIFYKNNYKKVFLVKF